ncbi:MAG: YbaB/EbfC family nucleoid-associated protein [Phycisphaerales bacterium]
MFDNLRGMKEVAGLLKDLPRMKARMEEIKGQLEAVRVEGESGGGAVRCTATGAMKVISVEVDPAMMAALIGPPESADHEMAGELIAGAVNAALTRAREAAEQHMQAAADDLGLPVPPGGLGGMLG